jgi:hypothetical protein
MLVEKLNYLSVLSVENDIKLSYEEAIKEYAAKNEGKKTLLEI